MPSTTSDNILEMIKEFQAAVDAARAAAQQAAYNEACDTAANKLYESYVHRCHCRRCPRCGGLVDPPLPYRDYDRYWDYNPPPQDPETHPSDTSIKSYC